LKIEVYSRSGHCVWCHYRIVTNRCLMAFQGFFSAEIRFVEDVKLINLLSATDKCRS